MNNEEHLLNRRHFVKLGSAAAAFAGTSTRFSLPAGSEELGKRTQPSAPIRLRSPELELSFDPSDGLPYTYRLLASGIVFGGEGYGEPLRVTIGRRKPWSFATRTIRPSGQTLTSTQADFYFSVLWGNEPAAAFNLRYVLDHSTVRITLENVQEQNGFELICLSMPSLVTITEKDNHAWLAHGDQGGNVAALREATAGKLPLNSFWGEINGVLPVVMLGHSGAVCVQETTAYMDGTLLEVKTDGSQRRAAIGTTKVFRVNGSGCQNLNLGRGAPLNCGNEETPNLIIGQQSACRLDFLGPSASSAPRTWLDGAKLVRSRMPRIPKTLYHDRYVYGIRCDEPQYPEPSATFVQGAQLIQDVCALTDGAPQLVHLWGWQFRGKDTGYPAVNVVDERIGGYDGMMHLMSRGKDWNAIISLSDNYDDAYRSSPAWDEAMIARRPDGKLWKSRAWTGEESYIQGLAKYMEGPGRERVSYTCERYKLPANIHVDVLSYYAIRNDWDPQKPASGIRNLIDGRYRVLEEFAKHGVDVSSEGLRYPFIGKMSFCWYAQGPSPCPFGGQPVPMLPLIYRKAAVWGRASNKGNVADLLSTMLFYGESIHSILRADISRTDVTDSFYLSMVPWFKLHMLDIEDFTREGQIVTLTLEGKANNIVIDQEKKTYTVTLDNNQVAREGQTFCPLGQNRIALYSITAGPLTATLPDGWDPARTVALTLSTTGRAAAAIRKSGRHVTVALEARRPVLLYRDEAAARTNPAALC